MGQKNIGQQMELTYTQEANSYKAALAGKFGYFKIKCSFVSKYPGYPKANSKN